MMEQKTAKVDSRVYERLRQRATKGEMFNEIVEQLPGEVKEMETETEAPR